jgi:hypothetical protein
MTFYGLAILGFRNLGSVQQDFGCGVVSASNPYGKTVKRCFFCANYWVLDFGDYVRKFFN